jgi:Fur family zinc uptake transcriptional regulator
MRSAEAQCRTLGLKLTDLRRQVFQVLSKAPSALGAYDIIDALAQGGGRRVAPISIYRALDFLKEAGLVHKIESLNAFVACPYHHGRDAVVVFMICDSCGRVDEATSDAVDRSLKDVAARAGFQPRGEVIEMAGRCIACAAPAGLRPEAGIATA